MLELAVVVLMFVGIGFAMRMDVTPRVKAEPRAVAPGSAPPTSQTHTTQTQHLTTPARTTPQAPAAMKPSGARHAA